MKLEKIKNNITNVKHKVGEKKKLLVASAMVALMQTSAYATVDAKSTVESLIGVITDVFFYVGVLLLLWSLGQLFLAFRNEDSDSKVRSITAIVASILLMGIGTFFSELGVI